MKSRLSFSDGLLLGWAGLLVVKYWIVGVDRWNAALHPTRSENCPYVGVDK